MALSTYAELQTAIALHLDRTDMAAPIRDFIRLAEQEMSDRLKCREMDVRETITITDGEADIPAALQSVRAMRLGTTPFTSIAPEGIEALEARDPAHAGNPQTYALTAEKFVFWPPGSTTARLTYRRDVPPLSDSATSNWVLLGHPTLYYFGALYHANLFLKDDQRAAGYEVKFGAAITALNERDLTTQISGMNVAPSGAVV